MKSIKTLAVGLSALGMLAAAPSSFAAPTLKFIDNLNVTHTVDPFGGFDWNSNATAWSTAPVYDGMTVLTTTYLATARAIELVGGANGSPSTINSTYEFTIKATIFETATCSNFLVSFCTNASFTATGGTFDIWYDKVVDSNIVLGTGFINGTKIISGSILPGFAGSFAITNTAGTAGAGFFLFNADVTFTNVNSMADAYFSPALAASNALSTLQIGGAQTNWTPPNPNWGEGGIIPVGALVFQADGNQTFVPQQVPEPGTLALVGLSLAALGFSRRRRALK